MNVEQRIYKDNALIKRKNKRFKQIIKILFLVCSLIIAFIIGFCLGLRNSSDVKTIPDTEVMDSSNENIEEKNQNNAEMEKLEALKKEFISIVKNKYPSVELSFLIKNLDTGATVIHNNKKMNSASIIKLFILETVYNEVAEGAYNISEEREKDLEIMITESNNEAANNFIDDFGGENEKRKIVETNKINRLIKKRNYKYTELNRKMHDKTPPEGPSGYQNYTCVEDVCAFLEGIYNNTLLKEPYNKYTLNLLKNQKRRGKIPNKIVKKYSDVVVANKTGELSQVENDAALIMCEDFNLVFVIMTDNIPLKTNGSTDYDLKEDVQLTISELGLKLVELYKTSNFQI